MLFKKALGATNFIFYSLSPFLLGAILNAFHVSGAITLLLEYFFISILFFFLIKTFEFNKIAKKIFLSLSITHVLLSGALSYFFFKIEGYQSFYEIQTFRLLSNNTSDINAFSSVAINFHAACNSLSFLACSFSQGWVPPFNNYLSGYKAIISFITFPNLGLYALTILNCWAAINFYAVGLHFYKQNGYTVKNFIYPGIFLWVLIPFCLPSDRETLGALFVSIYILYLFQQSHFKIYDWIFSFLTIFLIGINRLIYQQFSIFLIGLLFASQIKIIQLYINKYSRHIGKIFISLLIAVFFLYKLNLLKFLIFSEKLNNYIVSLMALDQDLWGKFYTGYIGVDFFIKGIFLTLTPFPYVNFYFKGISWDIIVNKNYTSYNILPIFTIGKIFLIFCIINLITLQKFHRKSIVFLVVIFILPVMLGPRVGAFYLIPGLTFAIFWILLHHITKNFISSNFKKTVYFFLTAHFVYFFYKLCVSLY